MQRNKPVLIGAAILGLLAIGLTLMSLLRPRTPAPPAGTDGQPVAEATPAPVAKQVVAIRNIAPRTVLTAAMLKEADVTVTAGAPAPASLDMKAAVGRLTTDTIRQGQPVTPELLIDPILKRTTPANFVIPTGTRAVAVLIDPKATMGDIVDVGDRVDVVVVHKLRYKNNQNMEGETRSGRTIARNLLVLATDPAIKQTVPTPVPAQAAPAAPGAPPAPAPPPPPPPPAGQPLPKMRVVVAAFPAEAASIASAQELGNIHLTLRAPTDGDAQAVPEAFEYPIRAFAPSLTTGNAGNNGGNANSNAGNSRRAAQERQDRRDALAMMQAANGNGRSAPTGRTMQPPPWPPNTGQMSTDAPDKTEPATSEITVIRGTEKTRVIVPQQ